MHPVGPRSSGVYWMRRMLVAVVAVAVVAAVVWFVVQRATGPAVDPASQNTTTTGTSRMTGVLAPDPVSSLGLSDDQAVGSTAGSTTTAGSTPTTGKKAATTKKANAKATDKKGAATTGSKATGTKATGSKTTGTKATDKKATGTQAAGTKAPNKSTATKSTATKTPATTKPTTTPPPPPSYDDQGRLLCPDASIKVVATSGAKSYPVGSQPILGMAVTNTGSKSCVRDLSGPLQVYTVYSKAGKRMWSTADCFPGEGTDVRQLAAGQTVSYNIKWSGTTSSPGCSTPRESVAAGSYTVVAALGKLSSKPHAFTVTG
jgi:hypothetical protein